MKVKSVIVDGIISGSVGFVPYVQITTDGGNELIAWVVAIITVMVTAIYLTSKGK